MQNVLYRFTSARPSFVMLRRYGCLLTLCMLSLLSLEAQSLRISSIQFEGIKKSQPEFLLRFIDSQVGKVYDADVLERDEQKLRNLQTCSHVASRADTTLDGIAITFECEEVITVIPFIDFGGVRGNRYVQVGVVDFNWQGRGMMLGGSYRYDGRHSFQLLHSNPFFRGSNWGYSANFTRISTVEPLFFRGDDPSVEKERINYNFDNHTLEGLGRYTFRFGHFVQFGSAYLIERFRKIDESTLPIPVDKTLHKVILKATYHYQDLDFFFQYLDGFSQDIFAEAVATFETDERFWKVFSETRYYKRIGKRGNFGARLRVGVSPSNDSPFVPFVLDSYVNIRGSGNRVARGTSELVYNVEYRHSIIERRKWGAIQLVGFVDGGTWRIPDSGNESLFDFSQKTLFYGGGVRFYFSKAYNFILRADYGINVENVREQGLVLGVGQYF